MTDLLEPPGEDGSQKIIWWLLGLFAAVALGGGSLWISSVSGQISELQHELKDMRSVVDGRLKEMQQENTRALVERNDRISALEIKAAMLDLRTGELEKKVDRLMNDVDPQQARKGNR